MPEHLHHFTLTTFEGVTTVHNATVTCDCGQVRELRTAKTRDQFEAVVAAYNEDPALHG